MEQRDKQSLFGTHTAKEDQMVHFTSIYELSIKNLRADCQR